MITIHTPCAHVFFLLFLFLFIRVLDPVPPNGNLLRKRLRQVLDVPLVEPTALADVNLGGQAVTSSRCQHGTEVGDLVFIQTTELEGQSCKFWQREVWKNGRRRCEVLRTTKSECKQGRFW